MSKISSPCVKLCFLDPSTGLCEGCGRTAGEIGRWAGMSETERRSVMAGLKERRRRAFGDRRPGLEPA